jgi:hypothetical protein
MLLTKLRVNIVGPPLPAMSGLTGKKSVTPILPQSWACSPVKNGIKQSCTLSVSGPTLDTETSLRTGTQDLATTAEVAVPDTFADSS